ncbi:MAG: glycosyltransferase family 39 protein [Elusimicrobiota bacterium]
MGPRLDSRRFDAAAFALALTLRLAFLAVWQWKGLGDVYGRDLYYYLAQAWLGWKPMPVFDATHPPLYTMFLAAVLGLFRSPNPLPVLVLQCLFGAACVPLLRRLGARLVDEPTSRRAALLLAVDPALIFFAPLLQTETFFIILELGFFFFLLKLLDEPLSWRHAALGLWGGLCALCRSVFGAYPAFLFLALWRTRGFGRAFAFCALLGVGWFVPAIAWTSRNYVKYGQLVPMSAQMGWTLYEGFTLDREEVARRPYDMAVETGRLGITSNMDAGRYFMAKTKAFVRAHPLSAARIVVGKAFLFWRPIPYAPHAWWQRAGLGAYYLVLFALALAGASAVRRFPAWAPIWALFAYLTAAHSVFFTELRYRLPLDPFLCVLAAAGLAVLARVWERGRA